MYVNDAPYAPLTVINKGGMVHEIRTSSAEETKVWGERLAQLLFPGAIIGLEGAEIEELGLDEYLFGQGVTAIEWFRFLPAGTVDEYLLVSLTFVNEEERVLIVTARGEKYERVLKM